MGHGRQHVTFPIWEQKRPNVSNLFVNTSATRLKTLNLLTSSSFREQQLFKKRIFANAANVR